MEGSPHILVVDDNREIRDLLSRFLVKDGFRVSTAADGRAMHKILAESTIDLIVLDLMLPGEDGLTLCRRLRAESEIPVVMLTAKGEEIDRVLGLEMGADDYLAKPFSTRELLARIKAVLRRVRSLPAARNSAEVEIFRFAGWKLDTAKWELESADGVIVPLSTG
ncbi:MAG TPA: response regulator, partial [Rhodospirillales bacterium]|nr:response regulator [Rhodospirillales bacterium]